MTLVRMSLSFIFLPDSREVFACFLKTVTRLSYDIRTSVAKISHCKFANISWRQVRDTCTKICINFLNMFKNFATSLRLVCDT